jgi:hypothetical protein
MSNSARTRANRKNAQHSTGPRTDSGKAAVSQNARRHGLSGAFSLLPHEDRDEFQKLIADYRLEFKPVSSDETLLIQQMAQSRWTLARARRIEAHLLNLLMGVELPAGDPDARIAIQLDQKSGAALATIQRYATTAEGTYHRARRTLQQARSRELRNKAMELQIWLKEQFKTPSLAPPRNPLHPIGDTRFQPPSPASPQNGSPDKL